MPAWRATLGSSFTTSTGIHTVTATPAVGDLIVVIAANTGIVTDINVTDNNVDGGGGTYARIDGALKASGADKLFICIRTALIGSATSTQFAVSGASSTGGGFTVLAISGMGKVGAAAARASGKQENQAGGAPAPAPKFPQAALTANLIVGAIFNSTNPATMTAPTSFTERADIGYITPTTGLETVTRNSGHTSNTVTWGNNSASEFASLIVELDANLTGTASNTLGGLTASGSGYVGTETVLNPSADTTLAASSPDANQSTDSVLAVGVLTDASLDWRVNKAVLQFDLSPLAGQTVGSVTLSLFLNANGWTDRGTLQVRRILESWVSTQATWNNRATGTRWLGDAGNDGGVDAGCSQTGTDLSNTLMGSLYEGNVSRSAGYEYVISLDATEFAAMVVANYGLAVYIDLVNSFQVGSVEHATPGYRPKLIVHSTSGGTPATVSPSVGTADAAGIAPTLAAGANLSGVAAGAVADAPSPSILAGANLSGVVAGASADAPSPSLTSGANVSAGLGTAVADAPSPSILAGANVSTTPATGIADAPNPTLSAGATLQPLAGSSVADARSPSLSAGVVVTGIAGSASAYAPSPSIGAGTSVIIDAVAATANANAPAPVIAAGVSMTGIAAAAAASGVNPTLSAGANRQPSAGAATAATPSPSLSSGANVTGHAATAVANAPSPSVLAGVSAYIDALAASALAAGGSVGVEAGARLNAAAALAGAGVISPLISSGANLAALVAQAHAQMPSPALTVFVEGHTPANRTLLVGAERRRISISAEVRRMEIEPETRKRVISAERRVVEIEAENRRANVG